MKKLICMFIATVVISLCIPLLTLAATTNNEDGTFTTSGHDAKYANKVMTISVFKGNVLSSENLMYIEEFTADEAGKYSNTYETKEALTNNVSFTVQVTSESNLVEKEVIKLNGSTPNPEPNPEPTPDPTPETVTFADISEHWAKEDIELLATKGIINGLENGLFAPEKDITRAEFTALLARALDLPKATEQENFTDVRPTDWYVSELQSAVEAGLINGYEDNTFKPSMYITREQMAALMGRAYKIMEKQAPTVDVDQVLAKYSDRQLISAWSRADVALAIQLGVIQGNNANELQPKESATRAETAVMLKRLLVEIKLLEE